MLVRSDRFLMILTGIVTAVILASVAFVGWVPQDEGTLGQAAIRVLNGEIPHVDFNDVYPGLQAVFHAGFFSILGPSIRTLRVAWLLIAGVAGGASYLLIRRWAGRVPSVLVAISAVVAGFVLYPASTPTWWNVSLGIVSMVLVVRGSEQESAGWLVAAGFISGLNVLVKTTGLYFAIPSFLWLLARRGGRRRWSLEFASISAFAAISFVAYPGASLARLALIWLPAIFGIVWIWLDRVPIDSNTEERAGVRFLPWIYFLAACAPVATTVIFYMGLGELDSLLAGWVTSPSSRFNVGTVDVPFSLMSLLLLGGVVALGHLTDRWIGSRVYPVVVTVAIGVWGLAGWATFRIVVVSVSVWLPIVLLAVGLTRGIARGSARDESALVGATAGMFAIVQIPFWSGVYTAYVIPLLVLAAAYLFRNRLTLITVAAGCVAFVLLVQSSAGRLVGSFVAVEPIPLVVLESPFGGIRIPEAHAYYNQLSKRVSEIAEDSGVYAGPDAPEVAYLSGVQALNENFWDVLDPSWEPGALVEIASKGLPVVINLDPGYSPAISESDLLQIRNALPNSETFGPLEFRWSE